MDDPKDPSAQRLRPRAEKLARAVNLPLRNQDLAKLIGSVLDASDEQAADDLRHG